MARNYNNNGSNWNWLIWLLGFAWLLGNFAIFSGSFEDLPILCVIAIIGDIAAVIGIITLIFGKPSKNTSSESSTGNLSADSQNESKRSIHSEKGSSQITSSNKSEFEQLALKYRVPNVPVIATSADSIIKDTESLQCTEVLQNVNKVINLRRDYAKKMKSLKQDIDNILICNGCSSEKEKIKYIKSNEESLQQKKNEYFSISNELEKSQVVLLSKESKAYKNLLSALMDICSSKISTDKNGASLSSFIKIKSKIPGSLFISTQAPVELNYGIYRFFLLPEIILVYDSYEAFVTALEPTALTIILLNRQKKIDLTKREDEPWSHSDSVIASDSSLIAEGYIRSHWMHERKSGGPDMRYSYNPMYQSRTNTYAYTDIKIRVGNYSAEYSLSKGYLAERLKLMVKDYCSVTHEFNAVPSLLRLINTTAKNKNAARLLSEQYESVSKNIICKIS